ncbi:MAG: FKBP-type peptidyl-prolyl cis-trans isomerase [Prevotella sp.]|nr:FKBP-type peptidyl-prolyl cis-trans isomerase [Prevotella sp.]
MRQMMIMALALVAGAYFNTAFAAKKDKKRKKVKVELKTSSDSLSYASGIAATQGLLRYLMEQYGIDQAQMPLFIKSFQDNIYKMEREDERIKAAGVSVATMVHENILKNVRDQFRNSSDSIHLDMFAKGFIAALENDTTNMTEEQAHRYQREQMYGKTKRQGEAFLAKNALEKDVVVLPSGLQYKVLKKGEGEKPDVYDKVVVRYEGRLLDGTVFDATSKHNTETDEFEVSRVIGGWAEALMNMPVGSRWEVYIPHYLGYGDREAGNIPPMSMLIFDIELIDIKKAPKKEMPTTIQLD